MELKSEMLDSGIRILRLSGRMDVAGLQKVELKFTALAAAGRKSVIVDLSEVTFIASLAIRLLLTNARALQAENARMVLLNPQPAVEDVLQLAGITQILPRFHDLQSAIRHTTTK